MDRKRNQLKANILSIMASSGLEQQERKTVLKDILNDGGNQYKYNLNVFNTSQQSINVLRPSPLSPREEQSPVRAYTPSNSAKPSSQKQIKELRENDEQSMNEHQEFKGTRTKKKVVFDCLQQMQKTIHSILQALDRAYTHLIIQRHGNHKKYYPQALFHKTFSSVIKQSVSKRSKNISQEFSRLHQLCDLVEEGISRYQKSLVIKSPDQN